MTVEYTDVEKQVLKKLESTIKGLQSSSDPNNPVNGLRPEILRAGILTMAYHCALCVKYDLDPLNTISNSETGMAESKE